MTCIRGETNSHHNYQWSGVDSIEPDSINYINIHFQTPKHDKKGPLSATQQLSQYTTHNALGTNENKNIR